MIGFGLFVVVELSERDLNKYAPIIRFKHSILESPDAASPINNSVSAEARKVNERGEAVASRMRQAQKRLGEDEIRELIDQYSKGSSTYELAEQFGCRRQTVSDILKRNGVDVSKSRVQERLDAQDVVSMYENMHTSAEIAKKHGVSCQTIMKCLRSNGIAIRSRWDYMLPSQRNDLQI